MSETTNRSEPTAPQRDGEEKLRDLLQFALAQENAYRHFMGQVQKRGGATSRNRGVWIAQAKAAAESCAEAYRKAGDEIAALRWSHIAKTTA